MLEIVKQAHSQFMEIESILQSNSIRDQNFFTVLSNMTDKAYITMNNGMCESVSVCQECAEHRDYLLSMLSVLDDLSSGEEFTTSYQEKLEQFSKKISEIYSKISTTLSSLK